VASQDQQPDASTPAAPAVAAEIEEAARSLELADPDADLSPVDRWINRSAEAVGVVLLAAILLIVFSNATTRYLLNHSIVWAEEVVILMIPWLAVLGLFLSARRRQMIQVEFFVDRLGPRAHAVVQALGQALCLCAFAYLGLVAFNYASVFGRDLTPYLRVPKGLGSSALVVGSAIVALTFVVALVADGLRARRRAARR
jgi:TRAP-type C4-dicarboxylate transport system permease small subunit